MFCHVISGYVVLCYIRKIRLGQISSGYANFGRLNSGEGRLGQVMSG